MRKHYPLNSNGDEDAGQLPWIDGVPSTGTQGSFPGHAIVTDGEAEILSAIDAAGLARSGTDLTQLLQSISRGIWLGQFGGTGAALTATLPNGVSLPALLAGMRVRGIASSIYPGGGGTLKITGVGSAGGTISCPIVGADGVGLLGGGSWVPGQFLTFDIDGSGNARFSGGTPAGGYTPIFAARTYYVNAATGSDANDGLTTGSALLTINAAIAKVGALNLNGNTVTIQLADGTYAACSFNAAFFGNGTVILQGNLSTPANVKIQTTTGPAVLVRNGAVVSVQGFQPLTQDSAYGCLVAQFLGQIAIVGAMDFPACTTAYHIAGIDGGQVRIGSNYTISGAGCPAHYFASNYGRVFKYIEVAQSVSILNPVAFTFAFAAASAGEIYIPTLSFSGAATTGTRYNANDGGIIRTSGGGATYIPGNASGTTSNGGVYS